MQAPDYDIVVVGGGPGGSVASALARLRGFRVLVAEKERFPRFHIGESLLPIANGILRETGVWPRIESAGFVNKYGAAFFSANGRATTEIMFSDGIIPGLESTFQVERSKFDELLLYHSRELGAEVCMETLAEMAGSEGGFNRIRLKGPGGTRTVSAAWVIDASGRDNLLEAGKARELSALPFPKRVAIYSHFRGVARAPGRAGGHTVAVRLDNGWFWLIPLDAEKTSVGLVTTVDAMRESGMKPEALFARAVAESAKLSELVGSAEATMPFFVTSDYSYFRRSLAEERLIRIGDAAGFLDPIFSTGVYMSMFSARIAVEMIARAHASRRGLTAAERRRYTSQVKGHAGVFQKLITSFYQNDGFAVFVSPQVPWRTRDAICSIVAGHASLPWPVWWRFKVFLAACWFQRHGYHVCPAVDYGDSPLAAPAAQR
ncbi:MAG: tryptophan 7-halogenase [Opitutaceae bacterium]|jgi:flavin-dependent dehydrogenase